MTTTMIEESSSTLDPSNKIEITVVEKEKSSIGFIILFVLFPLGLLTTTTFSHAVLLQIHVVEMMGEQHKNIVLGFIAAISSTTGIIAGLTTAYFSDRITTPYGKRIPFVIIASAVNVFAFVVRVYIHGPGWLYLIPNCLLLCLQDMSQAVALTCYTAMFPDLFPNNQIGLASGLNYMVMLIATCLGIAIFGGSYGSVPEWIGVIAIPAITIVCATLFSNIAREPKEHYSEYTTYHSIVSIGNRIPIESEQKPIWMRIISALGQIFEAFKDTNFTWCFISRSFFSLSIGYLQNFTLFYFADKYFVYRFFGNTHIITNAQQAQAIFVAAMAISAMVSALFFGALSDRIGRKSILIVSAFAFSMAMLIMGIFRNFTLVLCTALVVGPALGAFFSSDFGLINDIIKGKPSYATSLAVFNLAQTIPTIISSPISATVIQIGERISKQFAEASHVGYNIMFCLCCVLCMCSAVLIMLVRLKPNTTVSSTTSQEVASPLLQVSEKSRIEHEESYQRSVEV
jgi:MFS family permease